MGRAHQPESPPGMVHGNRHGVQSRREDDHPFADEAKSVSHGEIVTIEPPHLFEFLWEGELARWELEAQSKASCILKLTYSRFAEKYITGVPAGFHVILDQLETVLDGRTEPYPLGATTEDPHQKKMEGMYRDLVNDTLPGTKLK